MSRFPTAGHLISWAGLCPKSDESAGKRRSTRMRKGAPWLKTTLIQCAWAGEPQEGDLSSGAVPPPSRPPGGQEGHRSRRRLHPDRRLSHAQAWRLLSGPRPRALRPQGQRGSNQTPRHPPPKSRLYRPDHSHRGVKQASFLSRPGDRITVRAAEPARFMLLGGDPMDGPRHIWWNFVSSRPERIEQAKADWKAAHFVLVPGDREFIPLPEPEQPKVASYP